MFPFRPTPARLVALPALFVAVLLLAPPGAASQETGEGATVGPPNGALVIVGGALSDTTILDRFIRLAGGSEAKIVVIPTANSFDDFGPGFYGLAQLRDRGATNLSLLHTRDPSVADTREFVRPLEEATGVWFTGGRQWRIADAYLGTRTEEALWDVLERGGVIGGSSAGATIQGEYLVRGDTETNEIMMGDHTEGVGFLPGTAIVVQDDRFFFLRAGDVYDLQERRAYRPESDLEPLERPREEAWPADTAAGGAGAHR